MELDKEVGVTTYVLKLTTDEATIVANCLDADSMSYEIRSKNEWLYDLIDQLRGEA